MVTVNRQLPFFLIGCSADVLLRKRTKPFLCLYKETKKLYSHQIENDLMTIKSVARNSGAEP